jgi:hypothetical protein
MLRSFSEELIDNREFEIGGQVFRIRYPHWREGALLFDDITTPSRNGDGEARPEAQEFSFVADAEQAIERIPMFLDPDFNDAHARFKAMVERTKDPVPRFQLVQLYTWLVQVTDGRPIEPPSPSAAGGGDSGISSADASSSPGVTPNG